MKTAAAKLICGIAKYPLNQAKTTIGRNEDNTIVLDNESISSHHAEIRKSGAAFILRDLGSTNGTRINGSRVEKATLSPDDAIQFGTVAVRYQLQPARPSMEAPPPADESPEPLQTRAGPAAAPPRPSQLLARFLWGGKASGKRSPGSASAALWLLVLAILSAVPGWYLSEMSRKHQAETPKARGGVATVNTVAQNRAAAQGSQHDRVDLKNKKALEHVTIKSFNDAGISFATEGGIARVLWADLPDDWVAKFRDPVAATEAAARSAQEAAQIAEMERLGRTVQMTFLAEQNGQDTSQLSGSVVKVTSELKNGWQDVSGKNVFVINLTRTPFERNRTYRMRLYPTGQRIPIDKGHHGNENEKYPVYSGNPAEALQIARSLTVSLADLARDRW